VAPLRHKQPASSLQFVCAEQTCDVTSLTVCIRFDKETDKRHGLVLNVDEKQQEYVSMKTTEGNQRNPQQVRSA